MKSLLKRREAFLVIYTKHCKAQSKLESQQMNYRTGGKPEKADKLETDISDLKKEVEKSKYVVDFMTKALFFLELDLFHKERLNSFKKMFGQYAATQYQFSKKLASMWEAFAIDFKLTKETIEKVSSKTLFEIKDLLSLPLPEC